MKPNYNYQLMEKISNEIPFLERKCCTVVAFAIAEDITFTESYKLLSNIRKKNKGVKKSHWYEFLKQNHYIENNITGTFAYLRDNNFFDNTKTYIVNKNGHTFVIKNGYISEKVHGKTLIRSIFEKIIKENK